jgi:hypothetical protein
MVAEACMEEGPEAVRAAMRQSPSSWFRSMVIQMRPTLRDQDVPETTGLEDLQTEAEVYQAMVERYGEPIARAIAERDGYKPPKVIEAKAIITIEHKQKGKNARPPRLAAKRK